MLCKSRVVETENNIWVLSLNESVNGNQLFGPFSSNDEARHYCKYYFGESIFNNIEVIDFEHPDNKDIKYHLKGPPFKDKYWDFEDYKILAWRNAGFRSRK